MDRPESGTGPANQARRLADAAAISGWPPVQVKAGGAGGIDQSRAVLEDVGRALRPARPVIVSMPRIAQLARAEPGGETVVLRNASK